MTAWVILILCLAVSFTFTGIEAGILSVNPVRLRHQAKLGDRPAIRLERMLAQPGRLLLTVLLVTNTSNVVALFVLTEMMVTGMGWVGYPMALAVSIPVWLIGIGSLPKSLFRRFPYRALSRLAVMLDLVSKLLSPILLPGELLTAWLAGRRIQAGAGMLLERDEFKFITSESARVGTLSPHERQLIHNIVDFRRLSASDTMIPWERVIHAPESATCRELVALAREHDLDRIPIRGEGGRVIGQVLVLDLLLNHHPDQNAAGYIRRIVSAQPGESAHRIIRRLRAARLTLATICDPEGSPLGILSTEDILAHLVEPGGSGQDAMNSRAPSRGGRPPAGHSPS